MLCQRTTLIIIKLTVLEMKKYYLIMMSNRFKNPNACQWTGEWMKSLNY